MTQMKALALILVLTLVGCGKMFDSTVKVEADESLDPAIELAKAWIDGQNAPAAPVASATESIVGVYTSTHTPQEGAVVAVTSCATTLAVTVYCRSGRIDLGRAELTIGVIVSGVATSHVVSEVHARLSTVHCAEATFFPNTLVRIGGGEPDILLTSTSSGGEIILASNSYSHTESNSDMATLVVEIDPRGLPALPWSTDVSFKFFLVRLRFYDEVAMRMVTLDTRYIVSGWFQFLESPQ